MPKGYEQTTHFERVFQYLIGPESECALFCRRKLDLSAEKYASFMLTYYTTCRWNSCLEDIESSHQMTDPNLMSKEEFNELWRRIADCEGHAQENPMWVEAEEIFNKMAKQLTMKLLRKDTSAFSVWMTTRFTLHTARQPTCKGSNVCNTCMTT